MLLRRANVRAKEDKVIYLGMELIKKIEQAIQNGLPGDSAHQKMAPYRRTSATLALQSQLNPRLSGVLCLLFPDKENQWNSVLIKRQEYSGTHSAQVSFPGGKKEESDADLLVTSLRECAEEIGIHLDKQQVIGSLSEVYIPPSNFLVKPHIAWLDRRPDFVPDPREVNYLIEFPILRLLEADVVMETKVKTGQGLQMQVPYFAIGNEIVWGATAAILSEIREIIK